MVRVCIHDDWGRVRHVTTLHILKDILQMCKTESQCIPHHLSKEQKWRYFASTKFHLELYHTEGDQ
jgi:hypothetical protein